MKTLARVVAFACLANFAALQGAQSFPPDFFAGDYALVGREPGSGPAYAGRARIEGRGATLKLFRRIEGAATETYTGAVEKLPGGETEVLRFRGPAKQPRTLTCLIGGDLDNYARLSCYWTYDADPQVKEPGLETFFATGAWPDDAPHRHFDR
ncbi:MAG: hypothetical protein ABI609_06085 [Acidobacteriota bacterium]